jgi:hypothetical protein
MRASSCLALAACLVACDAPPPAAKPAAKPAPVEKPDAGPPAPPAEPIRVHFRVREPARLFARDYLLEGTLDGGTLTQLERSRGARGEVVRYAQGTMGAAAVTDLFAALEAAQAWSLSDTSAAGAPIAQTLDVRRGDNRHRFEVNGPCWCDERCLCPQAKAIDAANIFFHRAKLEERVAFGPPQQKSLEAPALEDAGTPRTVDCEVGPGKSLACEKKKCVKQGKQAACFESPFAASPTWVNVRAERKSRSGGWDQPWAFRTASGRTCVEKTWPSPRLSYECEPAAPRITRLFNLGKSLYTESADPDWSIDAVVELWK